MPNGKGKNGNGKRPRDNGSIKKPANGGRPAKRARTNGYQLGTQIGLGNNMANVRPIRNNFHTLSGSDFFGTITVRPAPTLEQRLLRVIDVSPSAFGGTRLTQLSQLWERYRFMSFALRWVPAVPTTLACQFLLYIDTDPLDDPLDSASVDVLLRQATAHTGSQQWNFHMAKRILMPMRGDDQLYYTGDPKQNARFNLQARAYLLQVTNPINFNGEPLVSDIVAGSLYLDWTCKFQTPQINPAGYATLASDENFKEVAIPDPNSSVTLTVPFGVEYANKQGVMSIFTGGWGNSTQVTGSGIARCYVSDAKNVVSLGTAPSDAIRFRTLTGSDAISFSEPQERNIAWFNTDASGDANITYSPNYSTGSNTITNGALAVYLRVM